VDRERRNPTFSPGKGAGGRILTKSFPLFTAVEGGGGDGKNLILLPNYTNPELRELKTEKGLQESPPSLKK